MTEVSELLFQAIAYLETYSTRTYGDLQNLPCELGVALFRLSAAQQILAGQTKLIK